MSLSEVDLRAPLVEFLSTTAFLYCGLGTAIIADDTFFAALVFGLGATAFIVALAASGYMPAVKTALFVAAQFAGGIVASVLLYLTFPVSKANSLAANEIQPDYNAGRAFLAEILCSYMLQLSVFEAMLHPRQEIKKFGPVVVGFVIFSVFGILAPIDNCGLNPARALGPVLLKNKWEDFWVVFFGPFLGALLAVPQHFLSLQQREEARKGNDANGQQELENV